MAEVKVPKLLHKMSVTAQKAWYNKNKMPLPPHLTGAAGKSAAQAKKDVGEINKQKAKEKSALQKALETSPKQKELKKSSERVRQMASNAMAFGGQRPGGDLTTASGIVSFIRGGGYLKAGRLGEENSTMNEVTKKEAEKTLGGEVKSKPKMPPGKQPAGYRYVRSLARKAMKKGMKEEIEQIDEGFNKSSPAHMKARDLVSRSSMKAVYHSDGSATIHTTGDENVSSATKVDHIHRAAGLDHNKPASAYKNSSKSKGGLTFKTKESDGSHQVHISYKGMKEEVAVDEAKKPDASVAMTNQLRMKSISDKDKQTLGKVANLMAAQKKQDKKSMKEESEMQYIEEKLSPDDPASKWISDFVRSDNPKFAGKSKKERIQQALGAYYAAKRGKNEEFEIEESKKMDKMEKDDEEYDDEEEDDEEEMDEAYIGFKKLKAKIAAKGGVRNPAAVAASIGRKKYGKEKFQAAAAAGKKLGEEVEQIDEKYTGKVNGTEFSYHASKNQLENDDKLHKAIARQNRHLEDDEVKAIVHSGGYSKHVVVGGKKHRVEHDDNAFNEEVEQTDEAAKDWKKAFSGVAQKNLQKDVGKMRSKVGRLNYIGMKPKVDATPKVTAAVTKKGSYSEAVEGKTPETSTEVELAKKHGNPKKITYGDVVKARIEASKKKVLNKGE